MINRSIFFLFVQSASFSPFFSPTPQNFAFSLTNCHFSSFVSNLYRTSSINSKTFRLSQCEIFKFLTTPLIFESEFDDVSGQDITERIYVNSTNAPALVKIVECTFHNITSDEKGGAIRINAHVPLGMSKCQFDYCISNHEAAILYELVDAGFEWMKTDTTITECTFSNCYSTGDTYKPLNMPNKVDTYPSVLFHLYLGFVYQAMKPRFDEISIVNCQTSNSKKIYGAYIHLHSNVFLLNSINCTNEDKVDSSIILFSEANKQKSEAQFIIGIGQAGMCLFCFRAPETLDRMTLQYSSIVNSTLITKDDESKSIDAGIVFINDSSLSFNVILIQCNFFNIESDDESIKPKVYITSNDKSPVFYNCMTNIESISLQPNVELTSYDPDMPLIMTTLPPATERVTSQPALPSSDSSNEGDQNKKPSRATELQNGMIIALVGACTIVVSIATILIIRRYINKLIARSEFPDEDVDSRPLNPTSEDTI